MLLLFQAIKIYFADLRHLSYYGEHLLHCCFSICGEELLKFYFRDTANIKVVVVQNCVTIIIELVITTARCRSCNMATEYKFENYQFYLLLVLRVFPP